MTLTMMLAQGAADIAAHGAAYAHALSDPAATVPLADLASHPALAEQAGHGATLLAQAADPAAAQGAAPAAAATGAPISADEYARRVQQLSPGNQEEQLGWLATIGRHFIGVFQKGGEVFLGFVTGIIPTLVVLMTAFYALTGMIGEERVHGLAQKAGRIALTRYTVLPVLAMFFLTNPMAYTFGTFLEEKHKPAFYDAAVSFCHPILGLFPHANAGEYFVWGGVLVALMELESRGVVPAGYHINLAIYYFIVGIVVILLKGIVTERVTRFLAQREGVTL
ncbi:MULTISPECIES: PTS glucitol/sorbitol transporter subunit IIC [unclassified Aureimonas]|uniref:PTS glucitol/sorbitol transporter subunit IIC n=1 Tax=unclassified Aureimonas TaxID=2615206 RepID=UPI0006FC97B2|nr:MULTISPECIES: PTS glucitol/sorbitol transporter subunit IIC [unclassified Aureimonas]KQT52421.1 PTS beta-glucoside transporter subunit IIABC [Aureimonas sp. Leaf427]KQT74938.1 PTS beta-glucoside transporter subunit IIABC [Aureimonas sp. Leaf460]